MIIAPSETKPPTMMNGVFGDDMAASIPKGAIEVAVTVRSPVIVMGIQVVLVSSTFSVLVVVVDPVEMGTVTVVLLLSVVVV